ncbi:hypothetical protein HELRODRAFT_170049 [Helobdella robusta]|uniref:Alcohol dehydrogenase-like N-terminal domain-containing protein n=1 Tax=Helobdella robusta TaxID=6412 RepID=T1F2L0_HELRO|nr:hypothetical protein HELRODRAFT_170049 [Helobdella robusta]ESO07511.1 hypothetical protein HELRODRAFT_170049 [Helobdella robusta]
MSASNRSRNLTDSRAMLNISLGIVINIQQNRHRTDGYMNSEWCSRTDEDDDDDESNTYDSDEDDCKRFIDEMLHREQNITPIPAPRYLSQQKQEQISQNENEQQNQQKSVQPQQRKLQQTDSSKLWRRKNFADSNNFSISEVVDVPDDGILIKTVSAGLNSKPQPFNETSEYLSIDSLSQLFYPTEEIVGTVVSLGINVKSLKNGDKVLLMATMGCKNCEFCSAFENVHMCEKQTFSFISLDDLNNYKCDSVVVGELYLVYDWQCAVKLPSKIPDEIGCLLGGRVLQLYEIIKRSQQFLEESIRRKGFANFLWLLFEDSETSSLSSAVASSSPSSLTASTMQIMHIWCMFLIKQVFCNDNIKFTCASNLVSVIKMAGQCGFDDVIELDCKMSDDEVVRRITMDGCNKMDMAIVVDGPDHVIANNISTHDAALMCQSDASKRSVCKNSFISLQIAMKCLSHAGLLVLTKDSTLTHLSNELVQLNVNELINRSLTLKFVGQQSCSRASLSEMLDILCVQGLWSHILSAVNLIKYYDVMHNKYLTLKSFSDRTKKLVIQFEE